jgi:iron complex outermembrane receptor protein
MAGSEGAEMRHSKRRIRAGWLAAVGLGAIAISSPALAQQQSPRLEYNLPAQGLGDALRAVARASQREIIFVSDAVRGRRAPQLQGSYTVEEAVHALLAGTDLVADFREDTVLVRGRDSASSEIAPQTTSDDAITITGSRIRGAQSPSPTLIISRDAMLNAGQNDLGEVIRDIPQNFAGGQNPGVLGGGSQGGILNQNLNNGSSLNLRGLGPDATLTLINGRRVAYDGVNQGVDLSAIPLAAIDRIEIVADGASANYGSDAVGGVANIILRRNLEGVTASARLGGATDGGNEQQQYSVVGGHRWSTGGVIATVEHDRSTAITARNRSYTAGLDDSATLVPEQRQYSAVVSAYQRLNEAIEIGLDGLFNDRQSERATAFRTTTNASTNGQIVEPRVRSFAVTPSIRWDLVSGWRASFVGTYAENRNELPSRSFSNSVETISDVVYENRTKALEVNAEGRLLTLPGGDARLAFGGGFRTITLDALVRRIAGGVSTTTRDNTDSRDVYFGYGELSVPLVGQSNRMPLIERFLFNAALRFERYEGVGGVATPKVGFIYEPIRDVTLRASWGRSFKAPTLNQLNQTRFGTLLPGAFFVPSDLAPGQTVIVLTGGASNRESLRPERATTWTTTLEVRPSFIPGLRLEASYYDILYRDRVVEPIIGLLESLGNPVFQSFILRNPTAQQLADIIADLPTGLVNNAGVPYDPAIVGAVIDTSLANVARQHVRGVDFTADYRIDLSADERLNLTGMASYIESDQQLSAGQPVLQLAGLIFNPPHWRARGGFTWQRSALTFSGFVNHIGGTSDNRFPPILRVGSFTSVDLTARLSSGDQSGLLRGVSAILSVSNLFNEQPEVIRNTNPADPPYDSTNYSAIGRFVSLTISKSW